MRRPNLALLLTGAIGSQIGRAVICSHVCLERFAVGAGRRLPSALLGGRVEVVR